MAQGTQIEALKQPGEVEKWWEVEVGFKRERTYVHLRLIHVDVWQNSNQYYKTIILQFKNLKKQIFRDYVKTQ